MLYVKNLLKVKILDTKDEKKETEKSCSDSSLCCGPQSREELAPPCCAPLPVDNEIEITPVSPVLNFNDHLGVVKARLNIGRMNYKLAPGLYAVGTPGSDSPVLVSANYKMSFDYLRRELKNINAWLLVLDTKGINVWCDAGKGTFGTDEIIRQIKNTNLDKIVNHRKLIVPQLGAPGVAAHLVKKAAGFKVIYGPVRAADLPAFLQSGMKAAEEMRKVRFNIYDRLILLPVELLIALKYVIFTSAVFFLLAGLNKTGYSFGFTLTSGSKSVIFLLTAFFSGTVIAPLLLPFIPGRAFALKGFFAGLAAFFLIFQYFSGFSSSGIINIISWVLIISSVSSFFTMNFTGASTYTSLSGVKKEMRIAVPLQIIGFAVGSILWMIARFLY